MKTKSAISHPNISTYEDVRSFLNAYSEYCRSQQPQWTLSSWARKLGLESTTSLTMILNGQRKVGARIEEALIRYFEFSGADLRHFQLLIRRGKFPTADPIAEIIDNEIKKYQPQELRILLSEAEFTRVNRWHYYSLRQVARIQPIPYDNIFLNRIFKTDPPIDFCQAIDDLTQLGLLYEVDGMFKATAVVATTSQNIPSEAIKSYHEEIGNLALKAIRKYSPDERSFQSSTLSFDRGKTAEAQLLINKFIDDFDKLMYTSSGNSVYQINVQFFPLTVLDE